MSLTSQPPGDRPTGRGGSAITSKSSRVGSSNRVRRRLAVAGFIERAEQLREASNGYRICDDSAVTRLTLDEIRELRIDELTADVRLGVGQPAGAA